MKTYSRIILKDFFLFVALGPRLSGFHDDSDNIICQGPVARSIVSASHGLKSIESHTFLWQLTLASTNHASNNSGQHCILRVFVFCRIIFG